MFLSCLVYSLIFFVFNVGFNIFKEERKNREKYQALEIMLEQRKASKLLNEDKQAGNPHDDEDDDDIEDYIAR